MPPCVQGTVSALPTATWQSQLPSHSGMALMVGGYGGELMDDFTHSLIHLTILCAMRQAQGSSVRVLSSDMKVAVGHQGCPDFLLMSGGRQRERRDCLQRAPRAHPQP